LQELSDLLLRCLQKNPDLRPTAKLLLTHPWITGKTIAQARAEGHPFFIAATPSAVATQAVQAVQHVADDPTAEDQDDQDDDQDESEDDEVDAAYQAALREATEAIRWVEKAIAAGNAKHVIKLASNLRQKLKVLRTQYRERPEARELRTRGCAVRHECDDKFSDHFQYKSDSDDEATDSCDEVADGDDEEEFEF
jgi:hypothetical protein